MAIKTPAFSGLIDLIAFVILLLALNSKCNDSCDTYKHFQYGIGECIDKGQCLNSLYMPGLCESKPIGFECCFSVQPISEEFRAIWIATVNNIDWPSSRTLTPAQQKTELISILKMADDLNMNAVIFQVRPTGDAFYSSNLEPWSIYLTGTHGKPPTPFWDPLIFMINEAHKRGIEVHAWLNPYRARMTDATYEFDPKHMASRFSRYAYSYGNYVWMDPGSNEVLEFILNVTEDILRRYKVDGIHIDDYFYPYGDGNEFPDGNTYALYQSKGGTLEKSDWRRDNVNKLVRGMYERIHSIQPKAKFGVSPFGIWKSGVPSGISGFSSYDNLYADSKHWLEQGWVDYMSPQLYWAIDPPAQSYPVLLTWWLEQSKKGRHVYPGNAAYKIEPQSAGWEANELVRQINITRSLRDRLALGNVFFSTSQIIKNIKGIKTELTKLYRNKALLPKMKWL